MPLPAGTRLGAFELCALIGAGGMGEVYKARDTRLDRIVAIKILPPEKLSDTTRKQRFIREAKAASALNHPNIVQIYDIGETDGISFISMEFVSGKTLDRLIPRHGFRVGEALKYAVQIADALASAHDAGIVHRDVKPSNVMITEHGLVKVLDFGLAKLTDALPVAEEEVTRTLEVPVTEEGTIVGTASYMSPEQAEGKAVDAHSDMFSFGAVLYEMLTGVRAFRGESNASTIAAILREDPKPASQIVEALPTELERILKLSLRKDPAQRMQHMGDLKLALEELIRESDSGTLRADHTTPQRQPRSRLAWAFGALGFLLVLACALWFARSGGKAPETTLTAVPLMTYPGRQDECSFSPDGNQVAFTWNGEKQDNFDIYVKLIGTGGRPLRLTTDASRDYSPAWSPDGRYIAFIRDSANGMARVLLVPALGGPEHNVVEVYARDSPSVPLPGPSLAWSPDGNSLVITDRDSSPKNPFALFVVSIETGEKRRLTSPRGELLGDSGPAFSPDGRVLAFIRSIDAGASDAYLLDLSDRVDPIKEPRRLMFGDRAPVSPTWTADGGEIIFANWFMTGLRRVAARSATATRLMSFGSQISRPAISHRGSRLAYTHSISHTSIVRMVLPPTGSGSLARAVAQPLISSTRDDEQPAFSPDGKRIAFVSSRSGSLQIWLCDTDGSNATQLTSFREAWVTTPRWSPDGEQIAFDSNAAGQVDVYIVRVNGGKPQRITTHPANDGNPSWSHDGRWIYFDSARSGQQQVFRVSSRGGEPIQLTNDGAWAPIESSDGKFVYYTKALVGTSLWKIPIEGGPATKVLDGLCSYISMFITDDGVYFVPVDKPTSIEFFSFAEHQKRSVVNSEKTIDIGHYGGLAVSPDRHSILFTQIDEAREVMLVENFH